MRPEALPICFYLCFDDKNFVLLNYFWTPRWCSEANWRWHIMGSCNLCLVSTWSLFC